MEMELFVETIKQKLADVSLECKSNYTRRIGLEPLPPDPDEDTLQMYCLVARAPPSSALAGGVGPRLKSGT